MDFAIKKMSLMQSYLENLRNIQVQGNVVKPKGKEIKELIGTVIEGSANNNQLISILGVRDISGLRDRSTSVYKYLVAEMFWYLSGVHTTKFIGLFADLWNSIKNPDGTVNSNYGRSVFYIKDEKKQNLSYYNWVRSTLEHDIDSRQAIIPYADESIYKPGIKDFTCTQLQHFFIRDGILDSIVYIRSSDAIYGLTFDIPFWSVVQQILFRDFEHNRPELVKSVGNIKIVIGSSHVYQQHYDLMAKMLLNYDNLACSPSASLIVRPEAVFHHSSDESLFQYINHELPEKVYHFFKLIDKPEATKIFREREYLNIIQTVIEIKDSKMDCQMAVLYFARELMKYFSIMHLVCPGVDNRPEFKDLWFDIAEHWFRHYFTITMD